MLFTLLNWLYILITCYICGSFVLNRMLDRDGIVPAGGCVFCGIALLTAYSEYFSLFGGVGLTANLILAAACLLFVFIDREKYRAVLKSFTMGADRNKSCRFIGVMAFIIAAATVLVCAYFTAASDFTYDTGTYHAQSIHWIETYGVVKGLAHMQTRLGFNNSYFALCALYSFSFLGQSMHAVSGFLAAFVMVYSVRGYAVHLYEIFGACKEGNAECKRIRVSDFAYVAPFAYFIIIATMITSPSTDFGVILMIIWLVIRWTECIEEDHDHREGSAGKGIEELSLLSVFAVFLITVKLSVGLLALITLYPLSYLIREKKYTDIVKYMAAGLVLTLPFFIRNYYITGWLVYPVPAIDIFNVDWKVPLEGVRHEADEVVVWARYTKDTALIDQSIREWFPVWWEEQGRANRFLSASAFAGCIVMVLRMLITLVLDLRSGIRRMEQDKEKISRMGTGQGDYVFLGAVLLVSFLFFMTSAPSNRFGYAYILLIPLYATGDLCLNLMPYVLGGAKDKIISVLVFIVVFAGFIRGFRMLAYDDKSYILNTGISDCLIKQRDYPQADSLSEEWEGMTIHYPVNEGEQIWYHAFPAILYRGNLDGTERRGDSVRDGFKLK